MTPKNDPPAVINHHQSERVISTLSEQAAYGNLLITDDRWLEQLPEFHQPYTSRNTEQFDNGDRITISTNPFGYSTKDVYTAATNTYLHRTELGDGTWTEVTQSHSGDWSDTRATYTDSFGTDMVTQDSLTNTEKNEYLDRQYTGQVYLYNQLFTVEASRGNSWKEDGIEQNVVETEGTLTSNGIIYTAVDSDQFFPNFISTSDLNKQTLIHRKAIVSIDNINGVYGTLSFSTDDIRSSSAKWVYTLDASDADTKLLTPGEVGIDTFVISYTDGINDNSNTISVEVMGGIVKPDFSSINQTIGDASNNDVIGGNDVDVILGKAGDDTLKGLGGSDQIDGDEGSDLLDGGDGSDFITTGSGADLVISSLMDDHITLTPDGIWSKGYVALNVGGKNSLGTGEVISLVGYNKFSDVVNGGESEFDTLELSSGDDAFFLHDHYSDFHGSLSGNTARIDTVDIILGGMGNDIIDLSSLDFDTSQTDLTVFGGSGDDVIWSGEGDDRIYGGEGRDSLFGSGGDDVLIGGTEADVFKFTSSCGANTIEDFSIRDGDQIELFFKPGTLFPSPIDPQNDYTLYGKSWDNEIDLEWSESSQIITWSPHDVSTQVHIHLPNFEFDEYTFEHMITLTELV